MKLLLSNCWFHTENIGTSFHKVRTSDLRTEYFAVWISQFVNKNIILLLEGEGSGVDTKHHFLDSTANKENVFLSGQKFIFHNFGHSRFIYRMYNHKYAFFFQETLLWQAFFCFIT